MQTFATLKTAVISRCMRAGDAVFAAELANFTLLAEQRIFHGGARPTPSPALRHSEMETSDEVTVTDGDGLLPDGYLEGRRAYWNSTVRADLKYRPPSQFHSVEYNGASYPVIYTVEGRSIRVKPQVTGSVQLLYYAKPAALSEDADTNWFLENAPGVYLHAVTYEAYNWLRNAERAQVELAEYISAVGALLSNDSSSKALGPLYPRTVRR